MYLQKNLKYKVNIPKIITSICGLINHPINHSMAQYYHQLLPPPLPKDLSLYNWLADIINLSNIFSPVNNNCNSGKKQRLKYVRKQLNNNLNLCVIQCIAINLFVLVLHHLFKLSWYKDQHQILSSTSMIHCNCTNLQAE